jgi:hypothetical protein
VRNMHMCAWAAGVHLSVPHERHTYTYISMVSIYVSGFAGMRGTVLPGEGTMSLCLHGAYSASNTIA